MKTHFFPPVLAALLSASAVFGADSLQQTFLNPPEEAKPHTWWHWCNGNISKIGITLDLEAMQRIGVGGAQIFNVAPGAAAGPVLTGSPEWRDLTKFAITEANRVGVELAIHNCPGWSESGGPWVKPEQSMQKVVFAETCVRGPKPFEEQLPQPETVQGYYRDIAVLAFPTPACDEATARPVAVTASVPVAKQTTLVDPASKGVVALPLDQRGKAQFVQVEFAEPVKASSLFIIAKSDRVKVNASLEASDDGKTFRRLAGLPSLLDAHRSEVSFPETAARFFRIAMTPGEDKKKAKATIERLEFVGPRLSDIVHKAGYASKAGIEISKDTLPASACVALEKIVDLTDKLTPDGKLAWNVPEGSWTVVRMGHTSTGRVNAPAPESGRGLECDKMSRAAVEAHFAGMMEKVIGDAGPLAGKTLKMVLADSWEAGCQNWTPLMREEFKKRRGYDPIPWLLTLTARPVGDVERSERFLWDFRRTIADLIAENHYGVIQELCHKHGMLLTAEAPGIGMPTIADEIQCKAYTDVPMGEFWIDGHNDSREPACAAHVYGRKLATTESFTAGTQDAKWEKTPFDHKALGDLNFCRGVNRFVFHRYAMQPWTDRFPGMTMGPWGTNFERTNTWWEQAGPWMKYLTRCQALLQSGLFSADVLYFYGEGAPVTLTGREPQLPPGFDFDACDAGALFTRVSVKDGLLVLPDGMSYRFLLLPATDRMTPAMLRRVKELAEAGATVVVPTGACPHKSPSLSGWPQCDDEVGRLANELWGAEPCGSRTVGKGRVVWGGPLENVFAKAGVKPDFESDAAQGDVTWIHRHTADADLYFVSNQLSCGATVNCTFRVEGTPEIWNPDTGKIATAAQFSQKEGRTVAPLQFEPAGAVFVVFRKGAPTVDAIAAATCNGKDIAAMDVSAPAARIVVEKAIYGADPEHGDGCADVTAKLASLVKSGRLLVKVNNSLAAADPALNRVKRLLVKYSIGGNSHTVDQPENSVLRLTARAGEYPCSPITPELGRNEAGAPLVSTPLAGVFEAKTVSGKSLRAEIGEVPKPVEIAGPWQLSFPPKWGAPETVPLEKLISWTDHADEGVKHFSGTATYSKEFAWDGKGAAPGVRFLLDLGSVREIAQVKLNGKDLGILWKPPFRVDATGALHPGKNALEVRITNLWPNRLIGDAGLPKEKRFTWAAFEPFKAGDALFPSGLLGPVALQAVVETVLK